MRRMWLSAQLLPPQPLLLLRRARSPRGERGGGPGGRGGGLARGPIGADGRRPLLGRTAAAATAAGPPRGEQPAPSFRVPGASVAARNEAAATPTSLAAAAGAARAANAPVLPAGAAVATPPRAGAAAASTADGDDARWQQVRRRGWNRAAAARAAVGDADAPTQDVAGGTPGDADPRDDEIALVKRLRQQGLAAEHPAMLAACTARDAAERAWREAKDPTPVSVRLTRAQAKLDRAIAFQAESRRAIVDQERQHAERMRDLQAKLDDDAARVRVRRQQLEQVQEEVGAAGSGRAAAERGEAVRQVHGAICNDMAPAIALLVDQLDSSTPAWTTLNGLLSKLAASKALLERAIPSPSAAKSFDIGDGDQRVEGRHSQEEDWDGWTDWSESHELRDQELGGAGGGDHWTQHGADYSEADGPQRDDAQDCSMGTDNWWDTPSTHWPVRWQACGHGKWLRGSWADESEREREEDALDADNANPPAARRRLEAAPTPTGEAGAGVAAGGEADDAQRRRAYEAKVAQIVAQAIEAGVQPITAGGEELQILAPHQLDEWVAQHLPAVLLQ